MDVLDEEVYTWRAGSAARGLSADTDPRGPPAALAADILKRGIVKKEEVYWSPRPPEPPEDDGL